MSLRQRHVSQEGHPSPTIQPQHGSLDNKHQQHHHHHQQQQQTNSQPQVQGETDDDEYDTEDDDDISDVEESSSSSEAVMSDFTLDPISSSTSISLEESDWISQIQSHHIFVILLILLMMIVTTLITRTVQTNPAMIQHRHEYHHYHDSHELLYETLHVLHIIHEIKQYPSERNITISNGSISKTCQHYLGWHSLPTASCTCGTLSHLISCSRHEDPHSPHSLRISRYIRHLDHLILLSQQTSDKQQQHGIELMREHLTREMQQSSSEATVKVKEYTCNGRLVPKQLVVQCTDTIL